MSDDKTKLTEDDEELVVVETDRIPTPEEREKAAKESEDDESDEQDDKRLSEDEDEEDDEDQAKDDEDNPNRRKRQKRRQLQKAAKERAERELRSLKDRNDLLEKRLSSLEGNAVSHSEILIDQRLSEAERDAKTAEAILAKAIEAGNGEDVARALSLRDEAKERSLQFNNAKKQLTENKNRPTQQYTESAQRYAQQWVSQNNWYKPGAPDEMSAITDTIDRRLVSEGYDPNHEDYWHELTRRVESRLGGGDRSRQTTAPKKKGPPLGSTREHVPASTRKEVYVTPDRKQAMIDAGIWDDPQKRNQMLKAYANYDREPAR